MPFPAVCAGSNQHRNCYKDTDIAASGLVLHCWSTHLPNNKGTKGLLQLHSLLCCPFSQTFWKPPVPRSNSETAEFPLKQTPQHWESTHWALRNKCAGEETGSRGKTPETRRAQIHRKEGELKHMASHASFQVMGSWKILDHDRGSEIQLEFCSASSLIFPATHANLDCCVLL